MLVNRYQQRLSCHVHTEKAKRRLQQENGTATDQEGPGIRGGSIHDSSEERREPQ